ncbi:hypothetical protein C8R45DRAFT_354011 [Mycena sanguinolenta]|nr:hypothetical protein C8R45DRAFT_354011 [Mycena sanguinolenta]
MPPSRSLNAHAPTPRLPRCNFRRCVTVPTRMTNSLWPIMPSRNHRSCPMSPAARNPVTFTFSSELFPGLRSSDPILQPMWSCPKYSSLSLRRALRFLSVVYLRGFDGSTAPLHPSTLRPCMSSTARKFQSRHSRAWRWWQAWRSMSLSSIHVLRTIQSTSSQTCHWYRVYSARTRKLGLHQLCTQSYSSTPQAVRIRTRLRRMSFSVPSSA